MKKLLLLVMMLVVIMSCKDEKSSVGENSGEKKLPSLVLILNGTRGDKSFNDLAYNGLEEAGEKLGNKVKAVELNSDPTKQEPILTEFSSEKEWDVILAGTPTIREALQKVAVENPEKKFILYDAQAEFDKYDLKNVYSQSYSQNEAAFLAGAAAAKFTSSGYENTNDKKIIGFIGGAENTTINDFLIGYIEGALYADPDIKILISYIGDFKNSAKAKEMALAQYQQGADVVFQVAGSGGIGVLDAGKEKKLYTIGVDTDQAKTFGESDPEMAAQILTSVMKQVDVSIIEAVKRVNSGEDIFGKHEVLGLASGSVGIAKNNNYDKYLTKEIKDYIDEIEKKIIAGEIKVSSAYSISQADITALRNKVKP